MVQQLIAHLDKLQGDLAEIDPIEDFDAANRIAAIALALRRAVEADRSARLPASNKRMPGAQSNAA